MHFYSSLNSIITAFSVEHFSECAFTLENEKCCSLLSCLKLYCLLVEKKQFFFDKLVPVTFLLFKYCSAQNLLVKALIHWHTTNHARFLLISN